MAQQEVKNLIKSAPKLEVLSLPSPAFIQALSAGASEARKGGGSLIRCLTIGCEDGMDYYSDIGGVPWSFLQNMPIAFPEMTELNVKKCGPISDYATTTWPIATMPRSGLLRVHVNSPAHASVHRSFAWVLLSAHLLHTNLTNRMRKLCIHKLTRHGTSVGTTSHLTSFISAVLSAFPLLEHFELKPGEQYNSPYALTSSRTPAQGSLEQGVGNGASSIAPIGSLLQLPSTLRWLSLAALPLSEADLDVELPLLEQLRLHNCGPHEATIRDSLAARCPRLSNKPLGPWPFAGGH
jgi:hypothetical protein